jgi:hypothetical protein
VNHACYCFPWEDKTILLEYESFVVFEPDD